MNAIGIRNNGTSCYATVIVQNLFHIESIRENIGNLPYPQGGISHLFKAFHCLTSRFGDPAESVRALMRYIDVKNKREGDLPQDSCEFLYYLIVCEELEGALSSLFGFDVETTWTCVANKKHKENRRETMLNLYMKDDDRDVIECFSRSFEEGVYMEKCPNHPGGNPKTIKRFVQLTSVPEVSIVVLNYDSQSGIEAEIQRGDLISIPIILNLSTCDEEKVTQYTVKSIIYYR